VSSDADPRAPRGGDVLMADNPVRILVIYGGGRRWQTNPSLCISSNPVELRDSPVRILLIHGCGRRAANFARATASFDGGYGLRILGRWRGGRRLPRSNYLCTGWETLGGSMTVPHPDWLSPAAEAALTRLAGTAPPAPQTAFI